MTTPTKSAKKTAPQKPIAKKAPQAIARKSAQPASSANERMIRSALGSAKNPGEQRALLAVIERSSEIMAKTVEIMAQTNKITAELTKVLQLKRGLTSLQASGQGIR
jgi:hypothetical protein